MILAALSAVMTAYAAEDNDTTVINDPRKVVIITGDSIQKIRVEGDRNLESYVYTNSIQLVDSNYVAEEKTYNELKAVGWPMGKKDKEKDWYKHTLTLNLGIGLNAVLSKPKGYDPYLSTEVYIGPTYHFTPKRSLNSFSAGLWLTYKTFGMSKDQMLVKDNAGNTSLMPFPENAGDKRAKVNMLSLAVPLLYNRWFDKSHRYGVSLGPVVNFNLAGGLYNHYEIADNAYDINTSHIGHRPVTIDIMAKFNTTIFDFYIKFSPMSLFKSDRGPEFSYITIGMSL